LPQVSRFERKLPGNLRKVLGNERAKKLKWLRTAFEKDFPPTHEFLRWMLKNPQRLQWPTAENGKERTFSTATRTRRKRFMGGDAEVSLEGLRELETHGVSGSRRKWWAFEGYSSVDCWLETEHFVLLVEGKRTEAISRATDWFASRNQLARYVEVARAWAQERGKSFGVMLCAEIILNFPSSAFDDSWPHISNPAREEMRRHYLGCITWEQIRRELCPEMTLPDGLDEAVAFCTKFR
jgi:hypothetical protein